MLCIEQLCTKFQEGRRRTEANKPSNLNAVTFQQDFGFQPRESSSPVFVDFPRRNRMRVKFMQIASIILSAHSVHLLAKI